MSKIGIIFWFSVYSFIGCGRYEVNVPDTSQTVGTKTSTNTNTSSEEPRKIKKEVVKEVEDVEVDRPESITGSAQVDVEVKVDVKVSVKTTQVINPGESTTWEVTVKDGCLASGLTYGPESSYKWLKLTYYFAFNDLGSLTNDTTDRTGIKFHNTADCGASTSTSYTLGYVANNQTQSLCKPIKGDPSAYDCGYLWSVSVSKVEGTSEVGVKSRRVFITEKYLGFKYTQKNPTK